MNLILLLAIIIVAGVVLVSIPMLLLYLYRKKKNPDDKRNTIPGMLFTVFAGVIIFVVLFVIGFIQFGKALIKSDQQSISIIGGADGPTAVFVAGKLGDNDMGYTQITMDMAKTIFEVPGDYIILDVRRADEFAAGHIPGAINVANESIVDTPPVELPEMDKTIYVYCRSGNRSRQAAEKLANMGYTNIIEFGGIIDWKGEILID